MRKDKTGRMFDLLGDSQTLLCLPRLLSYIFASRQAKPISVSSHKRGVQDEKSEMRFEQKIE